jgi:hypothetical protein
MIICDLCQKKFRDDIDISTSSGLFADIGANQVCIGSQRDQNFSLFKKEMVMDETVTISKERYLDLLQKEIDREIGWWPSKAKELAEL